MRGADRAVEQIAAARHVAKQPPLAIIERAARILHGLEQAVLGDMDIAPDAIQKFGLVQRTPFGSRQRNQYFQRFRAQGNFVAITTEQPASLRLDDKSVESDGSRLRRARVVGPAW